MKILYDHQIFQIQAYGGISRYFYEIMNRILKQNLSEFEISLKYSNNYYLGNDSGFSERIKSLKGYQEFLSGYKFKGRGRVTKILSDLGIINYGRKCNFSFSVKKIKEGKYNIFHPTYYDDYFLKYIRNKPFVFTIFDMTYEKVPNYFWDSEAVIEMKKNIAKRASKIITISESTKKDVIYYYNLDDKLIDVIYLGNPYEDIPSINHNNYYDTHSYNNYILFVGNRAANKNFNFFIEAVSYLLNKNKDINILCAGGGSFSNAEKNLFSSLNINNQIFHEQITDDTLQHFYKNAIAFVYPSLYEGFGIPILEAFSFGCPTALSNLEVFLEVAADAAIYFDPNDKLSILDSISTVINNSELRENLRKKGYEQLKKFSWQSTVEKTLDVYRSLI